MSEAMKTLYVALLTYGCWVTDIQRNPLRVTVSDTAGEQGMEIQL